VQAGKQARPSAAVGVDIGQVVVNMVFVGNRRKAVEEARFDKKEWVSWKCCNLVGNLAFGSAESWACHVACLVDRFRDGFLGCCVAGRCCAGRHEICQSGTQVVWMSPCGRMKAYGVVLRNG